MKLIVFLMNMNVVHQIFYPIPQVHVILKKQIKMNYRFQILLKEFIIIFDKECPTLSMFPTSIKFMVWTSTDVYDIT